MSRGNSNSSWSEPESQESPEQPISPEFKHSLLFPAPQSCQKSRGHGDSGVREGRVQRDGDEEEEREKSPRRAYRELDEKVQGIEEELEEGDEDQEKEASERKGNASEESAQEE